AGAFAGEMVEAAVLDPGEREMSVVRMIAVKIGRLIVVVGAAEVRIEAALPAALGAGRKGAQDQRQRHTPLKIAHGRVPSPMAGLTRASYSLSSNVCARS